MMHATTSSNASCSKLGAASSQQDQSTQNTRWNGGELGFVVQDVVQESISLPDQDMRARNVNEFDILECSGDFPNPVGIVPQPDISDLVLTIQLPDEEFAVRVAGDRAAGQFLTKSESLIESPVLGNVVRAVLNRLSDAEQLFAILAGNDDADCTGSGIASRAAVGEEVQGDRT